MKPIYAVSALALIASAAHAGNTDMNDSVRTIVHAPRSVAPVNGITPPRSANDHRMTEYPALSRMNHEEGTVTLRLTVNTDGTVSSPALVKSSGFPRLDQAAMDQVVANWRYYPAMKDGKPVAIEIVANIVWAMREDRGGEHFTMKPEDFPPGARGKSEMGTTALLVFMDKTGAIIRINRAQSSGYDDLDAAAEAFVREWKVKPAEINGKPVLSGIEVVFDWPANTDAAAKP